MGGDGGDGDVVDCSWRCSVSSIEDEDEDEDEDDGALRRRRGGVEVEDCDPLARRLNMLHELSHIPLTIR